MKPSVYGTMNLAFTYEVDHNDERLAYLQAGYIIDETMIQSVKITVRNILGDTVELDAKDWFVSLEDFEA